MEVTVGYLGSNGQRNEAKSIETLEFLSKVCGLMGSGDVDPLIKLLVTDQVIISLLDMFPPEIPLLPLTE